MSEIDWSNAPSDAVQIVESPLDYSLHWSNGKEVLISGNWAGKASNYKTIATRPQPNLIAWEDMREGMVVRFEGFTKKTYANWYYEKGEVYIVTKKDGWVGPKDGEGATPSENWGFKFSLVSEPPQRKTVADAVEAFPDGWPKSHEKYEFMIYNGRSFVFGSTDECDVNEYLICTRQEFEDYVAKQNGGDSELPPELFDGDIVVTELGESYVKLDDRWLNHDKTNVHLFAFEVKKVIRNGDYIWEKKPSKPIKPTITKAEAWDMATEMDERIADIIDAYIITN